MIMGYIILLPTEVLFIKKKKRVGTESKIYSPIPTPPKSLRLACLIIYLLRTHTSP